PTLLAGQLTVCLCTKASRYRQWQRPRLPDGGPDDPSGPDLSDAVSKGRQVGGEIGGGGDGVAAARTFAPLQFQLDGGRRHRNRPATGRPPIDEDEPARRRGALPAFRPRLVSVRTSLMTWIFFSTPFRLSVATMRGGRQIEMYASFAPVDLHYATHVY